MNMSTGGRAAEIEMSTTRNSSQLIECYICPIDGCNRQMEDMSKTDLQNHLRVAHNVNPADYFPTEKGSTPEGDDGRRRSSRVVSKSPGAGANGAIETQSKKKKRPKISKSKPSPPSTPIDADPVKCPMIGCDRMLVGRLQIFRHIRTVHRSSRVADSDTEEGSSPTTKDLEVADKNDVTSLPTRMKNRMGFQCPMKECGKWMPRHINLRRHIRDVHQTDHVLVGQSGGPVPLSVERTRRTRLMCPMEGCYQWLSSRDHINSHIRIIHNADPHEYVPHQGKTHPSRKNSKSHSFSVMSPSPSTANCSLGGSVKMLTRLRPFFLGGHSTRVRKADPRNLIEEQTKNRCGPSDVDDDIGDDDERTGSPRLYQSTPKSTRTGASPRRTRQLIKKQSSDVILSMGRRKRTRFLCPVEGCGHWLSSPGHINSHIRIIHDVDPHEYFLQQEGDTASRKSSKSHSSSVTPPSALSCSFGDSGKILSRKKSHFLGDHSIRIRKVDSGCRPSDVDKVKNKPRSETTSTGGIGGEEKRTSPRLCQTTRAGRSSQKKMLLREKRNEIVGSITIKKKTSRKSKLGSTKASHSVKGSIKGYTHVPSTRRQLFPPVSKVRRRKKIDQDQQMSRPRDENKGGDGRRRHPRAASMRTARSSRTRNSNVMKSVVKPFKCPMKGCGLGLSTRGNLVRHVQVVHKAGSELVAQQQKRRNKPSTFFERIQEETSPKKKRIS